MNLARLESEHCLAFSDYLGLQRRRVDEALKDWFKGSQNRVVESALYSLLLASKRIRPLFCLEVCKAFLGSDEEALPAAVALEMVHTYSLVHDDLPSMDNDDLRRGKPTNHKVYGEATALLAGAGLLTAAFEVLAKSGDIRPQTRVAWVAELADAAGMQGMVLGQEWDMTPRGPVSLKSLEELHQKKTGALLAASCVMGGLAAGVSTEVLADLRSFALEMGLAFQIQDDVLDVVGGVEIGKPLRSDEKNSKVTYVTLLGLEKAKQAAADASERALEKLNSISFPTLNRLEELTRFVVERTV